MGRTNCVLEKGCIYPVHYCEDCDRFTAKKSAEVGMSGSEGCSMPDLKGFADEIFSCVFEGNDFSGGEIEDLGRKYGLLVPEKKTEPCGENCLCAEITDFPVVCNRKVY